MEIESQRQHFFRWRERVSEHGYVLGLKFKTKIYHPEAREDKDELDNVGNDQGVDSCSICIIELEDGERIADLNCKHYFHADCLSEWIKKKVCMYIGCVLTQVFYQSCFDSSPLI